LILTHHGLSLNGEAHSSATAAENFYTLLLKDFETQMEYLKRENIRPLLLDEFLGERCGSTQKTVVITFDDGHESDFALALPVLQRLGFAAVFFVCVEWIGRPGYMDWEQLEKLSQAGMSIQSHGLLHHDLTQLTEDEIYHELLSARLCLERNLGRPVRYLAAPGGFVNDRVYRAAFRAGHVAVCNSRPGLARPVRVLNRVVLQRCVSQRQFQRVVQRDRKRLFILSVMNAGVTTLKGMIGVQRYEALKQRFF
jgi:peptidoglycan/xylan/chitin deacetylase (PgdA/CDA1 family)